MKFAQAEIKGKTINYTYLNDVIVIKGDRGSLEALTLELFKQGGSTTKDEDIKERFNEEYDGSSLCRQFRFNFGMHILSVRADKTGDYGSAGERIVYYRYNEVLGIGFDRVKAHFEKVLGITQKTQSLMYDFQYSSRRIDVCGFADGKCFNKSTELNEPLGELTPVEVKVAEQTLLNTLSIEYGIPTREMKRM